MSNPPVKLKAFEAFNARFLSPEEVARTFIPPPQYARLVEQSHSVLFGPRGSGKTTLLKMLQLRSLVNWEHQDADRVRDEISFHAIFLGTDVLWGSQLESRTASIEDPEKSSQIRRTSFRLHLALAVLNAISEARDPQISDHPQLKRFSIDYDRESEGELVTSLAPLWKLQPPSATLLGLRTAIQVQLTDLLSLVNRLRLDPKERLPEYTHLEPIASVVAALDIINDHFQQPFRKWAILCDELEIAPEMIREELFRLLRSSYPNLIFKFSFFPYSSDLELSAIATPDAPSAGNDYLPLDLTYGKREGAYEFCEALLNGMVKMAGGPDRVSPEDVLGDGWFDGGRSHRRSRVSPYKPPEGEFYRRATRLAKNDSTFRKWLARSNISLAKVHLLRDEDQAPFRKALPFILTRSEFIGPGGRRRSRKSLSLYTGTYSLFSLTEGNPRTFINLMRPLVASYVARGTVGREPQANSAQTTIHRFRASLSAIPTSQAGSIHSILHLIEIIGSYFQVAQLDEVFRAEPPSTFIVDHETPAEVVTLVGRSLNAGAFVRMDNDHPSGLTQLSGARLRLAYTLAPEYKLPLISGRSINLSTILAARDAGRRRDPAYLHQTRLPFFT